MTLIQQIRQDQLQARKDKAVHASLLTTLLGEAAMVGKSDDNRETTDAEVTVVVKKFIKNARETIDALTGPGGSTMRPENIAALKHEIEVLSNYLPQQLSADRLLEIVNEQFAIGAIEKSAKAKGSVMKFLKDNYAGQYDGKVATAIIDDVLKS